MTRGSAYVNKNPVRALRNAYRGWIMRLAVAARRTPRKARVSLYYRGASAPKAEFFSDSTLGYLPQRVPFLFSCTYNGHAYIDNNDNTGQAQRRYPPRRR